MTRMRNRQQKLPSLESYCILKSMRNVSIDSFDFSNCKISHYNLLSVRYFLWKKNKTGPCQVHKEKQQRKNRKKQKEKRKEKKRKNETKIEKWNEKKQKKWNEKKTLRKERKETKQNRKQRNIKKYRESVANE